MEVIEAELRRVGLWDVYQADVLDMDPILVHMHKHGMPIDAEVRYNHAVALDNKLKGALSELESYYPTDARRVARVYKKTPKDTSGLLSRPVVRPLLVCSNCGHVQPTKPHFHTLKRPTAKRPQNPCAGAERVLVERPAIEYYVLAEFKPSRDQLIRYQLHLERLVPMKFDRKTRTRKPSMDEKAIKGLAKRYPDDKFYPLILAYREMDKLAGTYIGRPPSGVSS